LRFYVYVFILIDLVVLYLGISYIIGKFIRKSKKEHHYTFHPYEKNGQHGYVLEDDYGTVHYYALNSKDKGERAVFKFVNGTTKLFTNHSVSGPGNNPNAPNFTNTSFLLDEKDVWSALKKRGIWVETTIVSPELTLYKIEKDGKPIAFARKKAENQTDERGFVYTMKTPEKRFELIFLLLFAIAKTEEFFVNAMMQQQQ